MFKCLKVLFILLFFAGSSFGDYLEWGASEHADGYKIYYNKSSMILGDVTICDLKTLNLVPGVENIFQIVAYNECGESVKSNSITYIMPMYIPTDNPAPIVMKVPETVTITIKVDTQ